MDTTEIAAIIIRNSTGDFFVHQRGAHKKSFPNLYGLGAGGHVKEDESPLQAATRELLEETGIQTTPKLLFSFSFDDAGSPRPTHVFEVITDQQPKPDLSEWQWSGWLSQTKVDELLVQGKLCPDTAIFYRSYLTPA